jgi:hypothetical protein
MKVHADGYVNIDEENPLLHVLCDSSFPREVESPFLQIICEPRGTETFPSLKHSDIKMLHINNFRLFS